jgi:hypothetical protein
MFLVRCSFIWYYTFLFIYLTAYSLTLYLPTLNENEGVHEKHNTKNYYTIINTPPPPPPLFSYIFPCRPHMCIYLFLERLLERPGRSGCGRRNHVPKISSYIYSARTSRVDSLS